MSCLVFIFIGMLLVDFPWDSWLGVFVIGFAILYIAFCVAVAKTDKQNKPDDKKKGGDV